MKNHQNKKELDTSKTTTVTCKRILEIDKITEKMFCMHNDGL